MGEYCEYFVGWQVGSYKREFTVQRRGSRFN
jgi:hypothetical protein